MLKRCVVMFILIIILSQKSYALDPVGSVTTFVLPFMEESEPLKIEVWGDGSIGIWKGSEGHYESLLDEDYSSGSYIFLTDSGTEYRYSSGANDFGDDDYQFTPVSNNASTNTILTAYDVGTTGVRITQGTHYTQGHNEFALIWGIRNDSHTTYKDVRFFHGAATKFKWCQGFWDSDKKRVGIGWEWSVIMGLSSNDNDANTYFVADSATVRSAIISGSLPGNTDNKTEWKLLIPCNAYALGWQRESLEPGDEWVITAIEKVFDPIDHIHIMHNQLITMVATITISSITTATFTVTAIPKIRTITAGESITLSAVSHGKHTGIDGMIESQNNIALPGGQPLINPTFMTETEQLKLTEPNTNTAVFKTNKIGTFTITTTHSEKIGTMTIVVVPGEIYRMEIKPDSKTLPKGSKTTFTVIGYNSNNSPIEIDASWQVTGEIGVLMGNQIGSSVDFMATKIGIGTLTAKWGDKEKSVSITVINPPPEVFGITPEESKNDRVIWGTITGLNFQQGDKVVLKKAGKSDIKGTPIQIGFNSIIATFDLNGAQPGNWDVVVTNMDGFSDTKKNGFTIIDSTGQIPTITKITTTNGTNSGTNSGTVSITINGANYHPGATVTLTKNGQTIIGTTTVEGSNTIKVTFDLKGAQTGSWDVTVNNPNGESSTMPDAFTVIDALVGQRPTVSNMTKNQGTNNTTINTTLTGSNFQPGTTVKLVRDGREINGNTTFGSENNLTVAFDLTGVPPGNWDMVVTNPNGISGTLSNGFTVIGSKWPYILNANISNGTASTTMSITIIGSMFQPGATVSLIKNGKEIMGNVTFVGFNTITATFDLTGSPGGNWDILVRNPDGSLCTLPNGVTTNRFASVALRDIHVYPNPYVPQRGHNKIHFTNLTTSCIIKIYTITGEPVREIVVNNPEGTAEWDSRDESGREVSSEVYIYLIINNEGQKASGKISIIR